MKKFLFILISFLFIQNFSYSISNNNTNYYCEEKQEKLTAEKVINDINEIKSSMNTALSTGKEIIDIVVISVKKNGVKSTMQIYSSLFVPLFVCGVLFLLYLRKRRK